MFNKLFTLTGKSKIKPIVEYLKDLLEYPKKFVVFCHHREVMEGIEEGLKPLDKSKNNSAPLIVKIDGSCTSEQRANAVRLFQIPLTDTQKQSGSESGGTRIILLSITAASTGLTLTESSTVIFAEIFWTPATLVQAEDRVHRIG